MRMSGPLSRGALLVVLAAVFVPMFLGGAATAATPVEGTIGPAGEEVLNIANPPSGVWTIESYVGVSDEPTPAHATATLTYETVPAPPNPTFSSTAPRFTDVSPPAGYQSVDVLERQNAGEPSLGLNCKSGNAMHMAV